MSLAAALLMCAAVSWPQAKRPPKKTRPAKAKAAPPSEMRVPYLAGERLEYRAGWQTYMNAATLKLGIQERREYYGRQTWHFQALATTLVPVRYIFALDDQFDSYSEAIGLTSLQYEAYLREQNKREDNIIRLSHEGEPAPADGPAVRVPSGTRDPLGVLYYLRTVDWQRTPTVRMPVFDGKKLYEVSARLERQQGNVQVPAGSYTASRIELRVFERERELTQVRIWAWIATDAAHTPVLIEAELPFGSVRAELTRTED